MSTYTDDLLDDDFDTTESIITPDDNNLKNLVNKDYTYPNPNDEEFQWKIHKKREFYYHKVFNRPEMKEYNDIKEFRDQVCGGQTGLLPQQTFLSNYINPDTPYRGVLIFHGTGVGKTCAGIAIAEKFKPLIKKYGTKVHVLVPGPILKENWKDQLLLCTGDTYTTQQDTTLFINETDKNKIKKNALNNALQYYRFMSYRSFYKKVLGDKIIEKVKVGDKFKNTYRKNEEGEFERDVSIDRIYNLNNTLLIVDEAHNLTDNAYGDAVKQVINNSTNLKVVLLSATPMKNLADHVVELLNFIRPPDDQIVRDRIFTSHKNYEMQLKPEGIKYLKHMSRGYVSYLRGADPLTFAKKIDKGSIPPFLLFTKITPCNMLDFQKKTYMEAVHISDDLLDRRSESVANFVFPGLSDSKELVGYYGREGIDIVLNQLKNHSDLINKKIALEILKNPSLESDNDLIVATDNKTISGKILKIENLKYFSVKFYKALKKVNRLIWSKKGSRTGFVYSNLVRVGIEVFQEILLMNGYLEFDENPANYKIKPGTRCYFCGKSYAEHQKEKSEKINKQNRIINNISDSSSEYKKPSGQIPDHEFKPATFVTVTGNSSEESSDALPEEKQHILKDIFSHIDNIDGKHIKLILGSKVMNEGLSLKHVAEVHILDVYFNLGKVDQSIGRAIRHCSHYYMMNKEVPFPEVNVYKYAITLGNGQISSEEELYQKAELKYITVKKVERALKEVAIDCSLNRSGNIFPEELDIFKNCKPPTEAKPGDVLCPALCDYTDCAFKCDSKKLDVYYDPKTLQYGQMKKSDIDYSTFTQNLSRNEINNAKSKIKDLYRVKHIYTLDNIVNYVKNSYTGEKKELFDDEFVNIALTELIPKSENDFNNFRDIIFDKYNKQGYLIHRDKYYIFQPFDQNENVPMYYRTIYNKTLDTPLTLYNYLKNVTSMDDNKKKNNVVVDEKAVSFYNFDNTMEYYDSREEFKYVGIIDKESSRRKNRTEDELLDVFKIRNKRPKIIDKKRTIGLSSLYGSVCYTSKDKEVLLEIAQQLKSTIDINLTRYDICEQIKEKLLFLEKYSTSKNKNKFTYVMIPSNHPIYEFPYNLEDRKDYVIGKVNDKIKFKINMNVIEHKLKVDKENVTTYTIEITNSASLDEFSKALTSIGFNLVKNKWIYEVK